MTHDELQANTSEELLFRQLYSNYSGQNTAVARHISVGEPYPKWVANRTDHTIRRIDALIIKRNVTKGDSLWGVEIKTTIADLRDELKNPDKTKTWEQYVNAFYFLVPKELQDIALVEIPAHYGVMVFDKRVSIKRRAILNKIPIPLPLDTWRRAIEKLGKYQYQAIEKELK